jgi:hypothetical protein
MKSAFWVVIMTLASSTAVLPASSPPGVFAQILPSLKQRTGGALPIYLPTVIRVTNGSSGTPVAYIAAATPTSYEVDLSTCTPPYVHPQCAFEELLVTKIAAPRITGPVRLANGSPAYVLIGAASAPPSPISSITWDKGGYEYAIDLWHGTKGELVAIANSMQRY